MEFRLVAIWDRGVYISTLDPDFTAEYSKLVEMYGPPDWVSHRETMMETGDTNFFKEST